MRDSIAGGSVYYFTNNVDAGPILRQQWLHVHPKWNYRDLWNALFPIGIGLLTDCVRRISLDDGIARMQPQDEALATWEPSWERPPLHRPDLLELGA
jgi:methionyl-tRNA formyltransferase